MSLSIQCQRRLHNQGDNDSAQSVEKYTLNHGVWHDGVFHNDVSNKRDGSDVRSGKCSGQIFDQTISVIDSNQELHKFSVTTSLALSLWPGEDSHRYAESLEVSVSQAEIDLGAVFIDAGDLVDAIGADATNLISNLGDSLCELLCSHDQGSTKVFDDFYEFPRSMRGVGDSFSIINFEDTAGASVDHAPSDCGDVVDIYEHAIYFNKVHASSESSSLPLWRAA